MKIHDKGILRDVLALLVLASSRDGSLTADALRQIERDVRDDWGGSEMYIPHGRFMEDDIRNREIRALWVSKKLDKRQLATRYRLSIRQINRIQKE